MVFEALDAGTIHSFFSCAISGLELKGGPRVFHFGCLVKTTSLGPIVFSCLSRQWSSSLWIMLIGAESLAG